MLPPKTHLLSAGAPGARPAAVFLTAPLSICYTRVLRQAIVESEARGKWQTNVEPQDGGARADRDGGRSSASIALIPGHAAPSTTRISTCFVSSSTIAVGSARHARPATAASTRARSLLRSSAPVRWPWSSTPPTRHAPQPTKPQPRRDDRGPARLSLCVGSTAYLSPRRHREHGVPRGKPDDSQKWTPARAERSGAGVAGLGPRVRSEQTTIRTWCRRSRTAGPLPPLPLTGDSRAVTRRLTDSPRPPAPPPAEPGRRRPSSCSCPRGACPAGAGPTPRPPCCGARPVPSTPVRSPPHRRPRAMASFQITSSPLHSRWNR